MEIYLCIAHSGAPYDCAQNQVPPIYHRARGLYFLAVIYAVTIGYNGFNSISRVVQVFMWQWSIIFNFS